MPSSMRCQSCPRSKQQQQQRRRLPSVEGCGQQQTTALVAVEGVSLCCQICVAVLRAAMERIEGGQFSTEKCGSFFSN